MMAGESTHDLISTAQIGDSSRVLDICYSLLDDLNALSARVAKLENAGSKPTEAEVYNAAMLDSHRSLMDDLTAKAKNSAITTSDVKSTLELAIAEWYKSDFISVTNPRLSRLTERLLKALERHERISNHVRDRLRGENYSPLAKMLREAIFDVIDHGPDDLNSRWRFYELEPGVSEELANVDRETFADDVISRWDELAQGTETFRLIHSVLPQIQTDYAAVSDREDVPPRDLYTMVTAVGDLLEIISGLLNEKGNL